MKNTIKGALIVAAILVLSMALVSWLEQLTTQVQR